MRVTFRADATPTVGAGHVMRCWALAEELASVGAEISWQGRVKVPWISEKISRTGWRLLSAKGDTRQQAHEASADLVVVDSYELDRTYREELLEAGTPVVAIVDDFHNDLGPGSLWVNPGAECGWAAPRGGALLHGPQYVLLRAEIRRLRELRSARQPPHPTITVLLGGTDFAGLKRLAPVLGERFGHSYDIVAGPGSPDLGGIVTWLPAGSELLARAALSDLVVSPAGVSSWEMLHIGAPLALIQATDNQLGNYEWMVGNELATGLGTAAEVLEDGVIAGSLLSPSPLATERARVASRIVDGLGATRVADAVLGLLG